MLKEHLNMVDSPCIRSIFRILYNFREISLPAPPPQVWPVCCDRPGVPAPPRPGIQAAAAQTSQRNPHASLVPSVSRHPTLFLVLSTMHTPGCTLGHIYWCDDVNEIFTSIVVFRSHVSLWNCVNVECPLWSYSGWQMQINIINICIQWRLF